MDQKLIIIVISLESGENAMGKMLLLDTGERKPCYRPIFTPAPTEISNFSNYYPL